MCAREKGFSLGALACVSDDKQHGYAEINKLTDHRAWRLFGGAVPCTRTGAEHLSGKQKANQAEQRRGLFSLKFFFSLSRQCSSRPSIQTLRPYGVRTVWEMPNAVTEGQKGQKEKSRYGKFRTFYSQIVGDRGRGETGVH